MIALLAVMALLCAVGWVVDRHVDWRFHDAAVMTVVLSILLLGVALIVWLLLTPPGMFDDCRRPEVVCTYEDQQP